jgi:hypothetical protein
MFDDIKEFLQGKDGLYLDELNKINDTSVGDNNLQIINKYK